MFALLKCPRCGASVPSASVAASGGMEQYQCPACGVNLRKRRRQNLGYVIAIGLAVGLIGATLGVLDGPLWLFLLLGAVGVFFWFRWELTLEEASQ
jgi:uncharacterized C2H2 Zn-finger protein